MLKPGDRFIYTKDDIEYVATIIKHDLKNKTFYLTLVGEGKCEIVADSIQVDPLNILK